jgi:hypothetical protein
MRTFEKLLLLAEVPPWNAGWRFVAGLVLGHSLHAVCGEPPSAMSFFIMFLGFLITLRGLPIVVRRLLPFSNHAKIIWAERRRLAKLYDSYQWRKLFWIGLGLATFGILIGELKGPIGILVGFCLLGGGFGLWAYYRRGIHNVEIS